MSAEQSRPMLTDEDIANVRLRIEQGQDLCLGAHTVEHLGPDPSDHSYLVWCTCNGKVIGDKLRLPWTSQDRSDEIRLHILTKMAQHDSQVAAAIILELLGRMDDLETQRVDALMEVHWDIPGSKEI